MNGIVLTNEEFEVFSEICTSEISKIQVVNENASSVKLLFYDENLLERVIEKIENADIAEEPMLRTYMSYHALVVERLVIKFHDL